MREQGAWEMAESLQKDRKTDGIGIPRTDRVSAPSGQLDELYREHAQACIRFAYLLTNDAAIAEDLVHDCFLKLAPRLHHIRSPQSLPSYLRRTLLNLAINRQRRHRIEQIFLGKERSAAHDASTSNHGVMHDAISEAMGSLSPRERAAIVLRYYEDLSEEQTADLLRTSRKAVNSLVGRGLTKLRKQLKGDADVRFRD